MNSTAHRKRCFSPAALVVMFGLLTLGASMPAPARDNSPSDSGLQSIEKSKLPDQAQDILKRIRAGGPFEHAKKDGSVFGNFEKRLPRQPRGYYREYTVPTPGAKNRGARRIVCGGENQTSPKSTCYYTDDHYNSFKRILE